MIARVLYSLPGPWQDSQSRGGVRAACLVSAQEVNWTLWQSLHLSDPMRVRPGFVAPTSTRPPMSTAMGARVAEGAGVALVAGVCGAGVDSFAGGSGVATAGGTDSTVGRGACGDGSPRATRVVFRAGAAEVFSGVAAAEAEAPVSAGTAVSATGGVAWIIAAPGEPALPGAGCPEPGLEEHPAKRKTVTRRSRDTITESHSDWPTVELDNDLSMTTG